MDVGLFEISYLLLKLLSFLRELIGFLLPISDPIVPLRIDLHLHFLIEFVKTKI